VCGTIGHASAEEAKTMRVLLLAAASCLLANAAQAQIRVEPNTATYLNPANGNLARALFGPNGYFMIAGGVVLAGTATIILEQNGTDRPVDPAAVTPVANTDGSVTLRYGGVDYRVGMPPALACPLGRFVARGGIIAYTVPKFIDSDSRHAMMRAGLKHHRIAGEFDGTVFEPLLHAADFAATKPLPPAIAQPLTASLNEANGIDGVVIEAAATDEKPIGSLINTDAQVRYRVYLMASSHQVEISGVPLRYFWELDRSGAAGVFAIEELAQNWPAGTTLTDWSVPSAQPTQYDVVNFYQVSGLFREMHISRPAAFAAFVGSVCVK
jgi:hypothetical protein